MAYSEKVLDHYDNPRNVGSLAKDDDNVGTGIVGAPACDQETGVHPVPTPAALNVRGKTGPHLIARSC